MATFAAELTPVAFGTQLDAIVSGGAVKFATLALAVAASIASAPAVDIAGYYSAGDLGGGTYKPTGVAGAGPGKFQSADGQWWILTGTTFYPEQFGAVGDATWAANTWTGTVNTVAMQNWLNFANNLRLGFGNYLTAPLTIGSVHSPESINIQGTGSENCAFVCNSGTGNVLSIAPATNVDNSFFRGFAQYGPRRDGGNTLNGLNFPSTLSEAVSVKFDDLYFDKLGGNGIQDVKNLTGAGNFSVLFSNVSGSVGKNLIDIHPGPACTLINCYPQNVGTGFRIHGGGPVFIGCNGINSGQYGAVLGDTVADDGVFDQCRATFIGCNFESFTSAGVYSKNNGIVWIRSSLEANTNNLVGMLFGVAAPGDFPGDIDDPINSFELNGGTWLNGAPIHFAGAFPFGRIGGIASTTFYDDTHTSAVVVAPGANIQILSLENYGPLIKTVKLDYPLTASTTQTLVGALALTAQVNILGTVANSGDSVSLLPSAVGTWQEVWNQGANPAWVYPHASGDTIDGGGAGAKVVLTNGKRALFRCVVAGTWVSAQLGAVSA